MTNAELNFYERIPNLIRDLVCEVRDLKDEVKELRKELSKGKE